MVGAGRASSREFRRNAADIVANRSLNPRSHKTVIPSAVEGPVLPECLPSRDSNRCASLGQLWLM
jgi:hypothetical protein